MWARAGLWLLSRERGDSDLGRTGREQRGRDAVLAAHPICLAVVELAHPPEDARALVALGVVGDFARNGLAVFP